VNECELLHSGVLKLLIERAAHNNMADPDPSADLGEGMEAGAYTRSH